MNQAKTCHFYSNIPNTNGSGTNRHSTQSDSVTIPQRRPSSNLAELLQHADGSNPSSPMTTRQNSAFVRSQQSSFECREDEEITNPDPKLIQELGMMMSQNGTNGNGVEKNMNDESKYSLWLGNFL